MPLYEYRCADCGSRFEKLRPFREADSALECPKCKSERVRRELSTFASKMDGGTGPCGQPTSSCGSSSRFT